MDLNETLLQLDHSAAAIAALAGGVTAVQARWKPAPEAWSMLEVINHLYDEEREDFRAHLQGALQQPVAQWSEIAPPRWVVERNYNERDLGASLKLFLAERAVSLSWLSHLPGETDWQAGYELSWGKLSAGDLLVSWAAHDVLHLRQLAELRYAWQAQAARPFDVRYAGEW